MTELRSEYQVPPEPPPEIYDDTEELPPDSADGSLWRVDDLDLSASLLDPRTIGMLTIAVNQRRQGVREDPPGSNRGVPLARYVRWFAPSSGPAPWCAYFVSWCLDRATDSNRRVPWTSPGSVASIHGWASGAGRLVRAPRSGDVFGYGSEHCGIVNDPAYAPGRFSTIEGNYSDKVAAVSRSLSGYWFVRI